MSNVPLHLTDAALTALGTKVGHRARDLHQTLVTAESCTSGWIAKTLTDAPGSSAWFDSGVAVYSYEAKQALLGVQASTLEQFGAVSRECVVEMVSGALTRSGASLAVAVTGIAGPSGGTEDKPVGTVWIGWKQRGNYTVAEVFHYEGDRDEVRRRAVWQALTGLRELLK